MFYAVFAIAVFAGLNLGRRRHELGSPPSAGVTDPFLLACLRGGPREVVPRRDVGLIDRGLLNVWAGTITRSTRPNRGRRQAHRERSVESFKYERGNQLIPARSAPSGSPRRNTKSVDRLRLIPDSEPGEEANAAVSDF